MRLPVPPPGGAMEPKRGRRSFDRSRERSESHQQLDEETEEETE
ncbi:MAG: hypothetical protein ACE5KY_01220 [Candidatus Tectimicrobiota bacterium]